MQKQAPSLGRILVMVGFSLSCVAILLYLWLTFGGAVPLRPKGYQVTVNFPEAVTLADQADVRISGVNVGKVVKKKVVVINGQVKPLTAVTLEINHRYAPIPQNTRAILRQKTLLGETYVELSPGDRQAGQMVPDRGSLANGNVAPTVQLDEIFRTFDPQTRLAFQTWMQQQGIAFTGRGQDLNDALGNLTPFAENVDKLLAILRVQKQETSRLVRNTGVVFDALSARDGQLTDLISNSNKVFQTTAQRDKELAAAFVAFPTFEDQSRAISVRLTKFAQNANPLITQLRPAAVQLSPTLIASAKLAPQLKGLFEDIAPLAKVSKRGLPAVSSFLNSTRPVLGQVDPFLRSINPFLDWLGRYKHEAAAFFALDTAATQATQAVCDKPTHLCTAGNNANQVHYLRTTNPVNPEALAAYPTRIASNRSNPYFQPLGYQDLGKGGLKVFGNYLCTNNPVPTVVQTTDPNNPGVGPITTLLSQATFDLIQKFVYGDQPPGNVAAVPCREQSPLGNLLGQPGKYPHVTEAPDSP
ncbi:MAG TPA: MlaD family protein [Thermoleophilaceae bacterium]|jgi:virulence factor Mce-like protein